MFTRYGAAIASCEKAQRWEVATWKRRKHHADFVHIGCELQEIEDSYYVLVKIRAPPAKYAKMIQNFEINRSIFGSLSGF